MEAEAISTVNVATEKNSNQQWIFIFYPVDRTNAQDRWRLEPKLSCRKFWHTSRLASPWFSVGRIVRSHVSLSFPCNEGGNFCPGKFQFSTAFASACVTCREACRGPQTKSDLPSHFCCLNLHPKWPLLRWLYGSYPAAANSRKMLSHKTFQLFDFSNFKWKQRRGKNLRKTVFENLCF